MVHVVAPPTVATQFSAQPMSAQAFEPGRPFEPERSADLGSPGTPSPGAGSKKPKPLLVELSAPRTRNYEWKQIGQLDPESFIVGGASALHVSQSAPTSPHKNTSPSSRGVVVTNASWATSPRASPRSAPGRWPEGLSVNFPSPEERMHDRTRAWHTVWWAAPQAPQEPESPSPHSQPQFTCQLPPKSPSLPSALKKPPKLLLPQGSRNSMTLDSQRSVRFADQAEEPGGVHCYSPNVSTKRPCISSPYPRNQLPSPASPPVRSPRPGSGLSKASPGPGESDAIDSQLNSNQSASTCSTRSASAAGFVVYPHPPQ